MRGLLKKSKNNVEKIEQLFMGVQEDVENAEEFVISLGSARLGESFYYTYRKDGYKVYYMCLTSSKHAEAKICPLEIAFYEQGKFYYDGFVVERIADDIRVFKSDIKPVDAVDVSDYKAKHKLKWNLSRSDKPFHYITLALFAISVLVSVSILIQKPSAPVVSTKTLATPTVFVDLTEPILKIASYTDNGYIERVEYRAGKLVVEYRFMDEETAAAFAKLIGGKYEGQKVYYELGVGGQ